MFNSLDTGLAIWEICALILFILGFVKYALRRKYLDEVSKYPLDRSKKIIDGSTKMLKYFKFFLWLSTFVLFFVPAALYFYAGSGLLVSFAFGPLLVALVMQEFLFWRWVVKHFSVTE